MPDMPRQRPPHLHHEKTRHGEMVWYVRVNRAKRFRLRAEYGTPEFWEAYHNAVSGRPQERAGSVRTGSLSWLWAKYRESLAWRSFAPATKRQRENIMINVIKNAGAVPFGQITKAKIAEGRDKRAATPFMAVNFVKVMRGMFAWAVEAGLADINPTDGVGVKKPRTEGVHTWAIEELQKFVAKWPIGTRERLAFDILFFTGLRRGDAVMLGRQHVRDGLITIKTEKTGEIVKIPMVDALRKSVEASATGDLCFIATTAGQPMAKESFGNWFGNVCRDAGVKGTAHGLRKALATILAENSVSNKALDAVFGWSDAKTSAIYTRKADREKMAISAFEGVDLEHILNNLSPHLNSGEGIINKNQIKSKT